MPLKLDLYKCVTFDIFDTLLHRKVLAPVDVFSAVVCKIIDNPLALKYHNEINRFPQLRIEAERIARQISPNLNREIILDEIYKVFVDNYEYNEEITCFLKSVELSVETDLLYRSIQGFDLYSKALASNCEINFISDMYLPSNFIVHILQKNGYTVADHANVFVSGELGVNKHTGELYEHVHMAKKLDKKSWLHIGDNYHADFKNAKKFGIKAYHAKWARICNMSTGSDLPHTDAFVKSMIQCIDKEYFHREFNNHNCKYYENGYKVYGPLLFGFYVWLMQQIKKKKPDKILFFARDSQFIYSMHKFICEKIDNWCGVDCEYVYVSRKSLYKHALSSMHPSRNDRFTFGKSSKTIGSVLKMLGLDIKSHLNIIKKFGFSLDTTITSANEPKAHEILNVLQYEILQAQAKGRELISRYFQNMTTGKNNIFIVDIGWGGNMQASFQSILGAEQYNKDIAGYYLGIFKNGIINTNDYTKLNGWIVHYGNPERKQRLLWRGGVELLEFALTADHGSTLGYEVSDNEIIPILEKKNINEKIYEEAALKVQSGMMDFIRDHSDLLHKYPLSSFISNVWQEPFFKLIQSPTDEQIKLFANLTHSDSSGDNQSRIPLAEKVGIWHRLTKSNKHFQARKKAFWKSAFHRMNSRKIKHLIKPL
jgi:predicted HAD superfamily hydrolase